MVNQNLDNLLMELERELQNIGQNQANLPMQNVQQLIYSVRKTMGDLSSLQGITTNLQGNQVHQIRQDITNLRTQIEAVQDEVDQLENTMAMEYRINVGQAKNTFETMSSVEQMATNPQAFQSLQGFKDMEYVKNVLDQLNGQLMDVSQEIEHTWLAQQPTKPIKSDGESPYDDGLPRPTLSP